MNSFNPLPAPHCFALCYKRPALRAALLLLQLVKVGPPTSRNYGSHAKAASKGFKKQAALENCILRFLQARQRWQRKKGRKGA